jgi:putative ABC transport system ATP-binding protein
VCLPEFKSYQVGIVKTCAGEIYRIRWRWQWRRRFLKRLEARALQVRDVGPLDFSVAAGECVCLSGASGAGKSILLRALADMEPHRGRVSLDGVACDGMAPTQWRRNVALLTAESAWWHDRVGGHFSRIDELLLGELGFERQVMSAEVHSLSTGERQRLALLRLLAGRPRVLLLDEPTASLDPLNTERVEHLLTRYREEQDAGVLWVSHDPLQVRRVAHRHWRLADGHLHEEILSS